MNFKDLKNKIKEEQKQLAQKIKICKPLRKPSNWESASEEARKLCKWNNYSWKYRHRHIVYCTMFNRTLYEAIESPRDDNHPNSSYLQKIKNDWESELKVSLMKLYVIVRKDLSTSQQAVQAGHALAEYLLHGHFSRWNNGTLIYLGVKGLKQLENLKRKFEIDGIPYTEFREPDLNNEATAIATETKNNFIEKLNLL